MKAKSSINNGGGERQPSQASQDKNLTAASQIDDIKYLYRTYKNMGLEQQYDQSGIE